MILPESRNLEWIEKAAKDNNASNPILVEKVIRAVAEDTIATALCISTNGYGHEEDFRFYSDGITRVRNFIHTERYNMIGAVRDAAKAAYAAACALNKIATPQRYNPQVLEELAAARIPASLSSRLNNLKTQNPEAFFYWLKTSELMQ